MAGLHDPNDNFPTADDTPRGATEEEWRDFQEARAAKALPTEEVRDVELKNADEALEVLLAGNARFVAGRSQHDHETMARSIAARAFSGSCLSTSSQSSMAPA